MGKTVAVKGYLNRSVVAQAALDRAARRFAGEKSMTLSGRTVYRFPNRAAAFRFRAATEAAAEAQAHMFWQAEQMG